MASLISDPMLYDAIIAATLGANPRPRRKARSISPREEEMWRREMGRLSSVPGKAGFEIPWEMGRLSSVPGKAGFEIPYALGDQAVQAPGNQNGSQVPGRAGFVMPYGTQQADSRASALPQSMVYPAAQYNQINPGRDLEMSGPIPPTDPITLFQNALLTRGVPPGQISRNMLQTMAMAPKMGDYEAGMIENRLAKQYASQMGSADTARIVKQKAIQAKNELETRRKIALAEAEAAGAKAVSEPYQIQKAYLISQGKSAAEIEKLIGPDPVKSAMDRIRRLLGGEAADKTSALPQDPPAPLQKAQPKRKNALLEAARWGVLPSTLTEQLLNLSGYGR